VRNTPTWAWAAAQYSEQNKLVRSFRRSFDSSHDYPIPPARKAPIAS
jgi:hypothetical protein